MENNSYFKNENEERYPHAADALERMVAENGFAGGWAMHQKPIPKYIFDGHIHYSGPKDRPMHPCMASFAKSWQDHDAERAMIIINIYGADRNSKVPGYASTGPFPWFNVEDVKELFYDPDVNDRFFWSTWIDHQEPDPGLVYAAAKAGAKEIKLHNSPVIESNAPYDLWLSDEWQRTFKVIGECGLPVLFHVTQRLPSSVYTGGGRNVYWKTGWEMGVTYGNEDLMQTFLTCCRRHPDIDFIGAHQLHIGWERLDKLFEEYPNLYVDTTVGCTLRLYDSFYPHDKEYLRQIFIKWADRIIFGTDAYWGNEEEIQVNPSLLQHIRFIALLDLPGDVQDKIFHGNMERIHKIEPLNI